MNRLAATPFFLVAMLLLSSAQASAITIETVLVGDAGNEIDSENGENGSVAYDYRIGKYEVTVGQYAAFLNSVAQTDTYALYNPSMANDAHVAGIQQSGVSGSYSYSVIGSPNKPVTYVSWGDAVRFTNWLHNGQPTGAQDATTTESGAYPLNGATGNVQIAMAERSDNARWFIPSEDEWYKAAYYQPTAQGGDTDGYWLNPTRSNNQLFSAPPPGTAAPAVSNTANIRFDDQLANDYDNGFAVTGSINFDPNQNYLTDVGAYTQSSSFYGTFDQAGNVSEWNEKLSFDQVIQHQLRGGSYIDDMYFSESWAFMPRRLGAQLPTVGFRVAGIPSVPEPSTFALAASAALGLLIVARRCH